MPLAGSAALVSGRGVARGAGALSFFWAGAGAVFSTLVAFSTFGAAVVLVTVGEAGVLGAGVLPLPAALPLAGALPLPFFWKYATHVASTLPGSRVNCSYISSTSHSLAPKSEEGSGWEVGSDAGLVLRHGCFRLFRNVRVGNGILMPG